LSLYPPTPRPCPSLWVLEGRYDSGYDGAGQVPAHAMPRRLRAAGRDRRIEARRQHVSLPCACTGTSVPARTHRHARTRGWRARTDKHTRARARVSATPTHTLTSRHPRSHMRARTYARTRMHTQARTHAHAPMALAATRLTACRGTGTCTPLTWTATSAGNAKATPSRSCAAPSRPSVLAAAPAVVPQP
jgi:hypothetical protein